MTSLFALWEGGRSQSRLASMFQRVFLQVGTARQQEVSCSPFPFLALVLWVCSPEAELSSAAIADVMCNRFSIADGTLRLEVWGFRRLSRDESLASVSLGNDSLERTC